MLTFAIGRVRRPYRRWRIVTADAVVAHVSPQACRTRFAIARRQYPKWRIVGRQLSASKNMALQRVETPSPLFFDEPRYCF